MQGHARGVRDGNAMVPPLRDLQPRLSVFQGEQNNELIFHLTVHPGVAIMHPFTQMLVSGLNLLSYCMSELLWYLIFFLDLHSFQ